MYLRINTLLLCCAILIGFATAAQTNNDLAFSDQFIEGSGGPGEVGHDLEQSGSGAGPDDEDTPIKSKTPDTVEIDNIPIRKDTIPDLEAPIDKAPAPIPTEDTSVIMNRKPEDRHTSFFAQPGILAAVIGGAVVGLLCAILVVMFIVYRMRKKDEGSYALGEPKQSPTATSYSRGNNKEFYA